MKKAIIIGGNQTGLAMAYKLGGIGWDVELFEQKAKEDVAYDWDDIINEDVFEKAEIPMIPDCAPIKPWTFVNPKENVKITGSDRITDLALNRKDLVEFLYGLAKDKAKINFNREVDGLIIKDDKIVGVKVGGQDILSDLVVDCSGIYSKFRQSLPDKFNIQKMPKDNEKFVVYRGFFEKEEGKPESDFSNKIYMRHIYESGISWYISEENGSIDVLIGRIGGLSEEEKDRAFKAVQNDNPILSNRLVKCGIDSAIPVRYPISKMVANGYVLAGDSGFMTIPMIGSGIGSGMRSAKFLSEVLAKNDDCSVNNLWNYQVAFYNEFASFAGIDILKRWMLSAKPEYIVFLFESGVLDASLLGGGTTGKPVTMSFKQKMMKGWQGRKKLGVMMNLLSALRKMKKAEKCARALPKKYDEALVSDWQKQYDGMFE